MTVKGLVRGIIGFLTLVVLVIGWFSFTETINQGHRGVIYSRSDGVQEETLGQGLKFVNPLWRITEYPVSLETVEYKDISLATKDGKPLNIDVTFDYLNDIEMLPQIYNKFKGATPEAIEDSWLRARLRESALAITSKYTVLNVFQNTENIRVEIEERFKEDVRENGFIIENVVLGAPNPDEATQKAIQSVVDKQQELEALKIEQEKAQVEADTKLIEAQGIADAEIEKARGQSEANNMISKSITDGVLSNKYIEKWDGIMPKVSGDGVGVLADIGKIVEEEKEEEE